MKKRRFLPQRNFVGGHDEVLRETRRACLCVREKESESEREKECVCVCVRERERE
jgi:hypothetical protein